MDPSSSEGQIPYRAVRVFQIEEFSWKFLILVLVKWRLVSPIERTMKLSWLMAKQHQLEFYLRESLAERKFRWIKWNHSLMKGEVRSSIILGPNQNWKVTFVLFLLRFGNGRNEEFHLKDLLEKSKNEVNTIRSFTDQLSHEVENIRNVLSQKGVELLEAGQKLNALSNIINTSDTVSSTLPGSTLTRPPCRTSSPLFASLIGNLLFWIEFSISFSIKHF